MALDITQEVLDRAALVLIVDQDGLYEWSSTKTTEEVGKHLILIGEDVLAGEDDR